MSDKITKYGNLKIYDEVYILDHYTIKKTYIKRFYRAYGNEDSPYIGMRVEHEFGSDHCDDIYEDESSAEHGVQKKKNSYDRYVTTPR